MIDEILSMLDAAVRTVTVSHRNTMRAERIKEWKPTKEP